MNAHDPQAAALDSYLARHPELAAGQGAVAILRAVPGPYLSRLAGRPLRCWQTLKPAADELARLGHEPLAAPAPPVSLVLVLGTKHKEEVLYHYALAADHLEEGGSLIAVAANDLGAGSLEKRCAELFGAIESYSKHKCRVFRARKDGARLDRTLAETWRRAGELRLIPATGLHSRPGLFSWKSIDPGSRLLAAQLPEDLAGRGADLGAGYGYLSRELLAHARRVGELHLFEAEKNALDAAALNLANQASRVALHYHWADVAPGLPLAGLDFVVMNPPFHAGREAVSALGRAFVRAGLAALKPGGRLFLVANRHLPYEAEIDALSGRVESKSEGGGFKVIRAVKA